MPKKHWNFGHSRKKSPRPKDGAGQLLFSSSIDHFQNEIHGTIDPVAGGVDAEVIVIGMAPLSSRIEIIIPGMPPVQAVEEPSGLPFIQSAVDLHSPADPLLKGGCDIDTDMGDLIIGHDGIAAAAHDDEVLLLRHIAKQIALVKEYRIPLGTGRDNG